MTMLANSQINGRCGPHQTRFVLPIADDVRLVTVDTARAVLGVTAEDIFEAVEDHESELHLPAFDLSVKNFGAGRRELRIWARALHAHSSSPVTHNLDFIIADCLLTNLTGLQNENFHINNSQLERAWCVSNQTLLEFIKSESRDRVHCLAGIRVGRNWRINRKDAAEFLRERLL